MAITLINSVSAGAAGAANTVTTAADDMTGADLLVLASGYAANSGSTVAVVSDSQVNIYADLARQSVGASAGVNMAYAAGPSVDNAMTFTCVVDGVLLTLPSICAAGFSGLHATPLDVEAGAGGTNAVSIQAVSLTPTVDGCLLVSSIVLDRSVSSMGITTTSGTTGAWSIIETVAFSSGNHKQQYLAWAVQVTAGAFTASWDWTTNAARVTRVTSFKPAATAVIPTGWQRQTETGLILPKRYVGYR